MSEKPHIGIVDGSTRQGRFSDRAATWFHGIAARRTDLSFEIVDLRDYPMPFFDEPASPAWVPPKNLIAGRWWAKLAEFDGLVFVTPEYNHGYSAVLKNALDYAFQQSNRKPAAFVGCGSVGAARAIEQLRMVADELQMAPIPKSVNLGMTEFLGIWQRGKEFVDFPHLEQAAVVLLDDLSWWSRTLQAGRQAASAEVISRLITSDRCLTNPRGRGTVAETSSKAGGLFRRIYFSERKSAMSQKLPSWSRGPRTNKVARW